MSFGNPIVYAIFAAFGAVALVSGFRREEYLLYLLGFVVSFVGFNVHLAATIYLSRVILAVVVLLLIAGRIRTDCLLSQHGKYLAFAFAILLSQLISSAIADDTFASWRITGVYMFDLCVFLAVLCLGRAAQNVVTAIKIYGITVLLQALLGIYQVVGGARDWLSWQSLFPQMQTVNDRTTGGFLYSGEYALFRATGLFTADVSHYAGFLASGLVLIIVLKLKRKTVRGSIASGAVAIVVLLALMLSLSRSGILTGLGVAVPLLAWALRRFGFGARRALKPIGIGFVLAGIGFIASGGKTADNGIDIGSLWATTITRFADLINAGNDPGESMSEHIRTRQLGLDAFVSSPLFGRGMGVNETPWYSERYDAYWAGSHSHHIDILGQSGLIGAGIQWLFMWCAIREMYVCVRSRRGTEEERLVMIGLMVSALSIVIGNLFYAYFISDFVWFLFGCGVAMSNGLMRDRVRAGDERGEIRKGGIMRRVRAGSVAAGRPEIRENVATDSCAEGTGGSQKCSDDRAATINPFFKT